MQHLMKMSHTEEITKPGWEDSLPSFYWNATKKHMLHMCAGPLCPLYNFRKRREKHQHLDGKGTEPKRNWLHNTVLKGCIKKLLTRMAGADNGWLDCSSAAWNGKEAAWQDTVLNSSSALQLLPDQEAVPQASCTGRELTCQKSWGSKTF